MNSIYLIVYPNIVLWCVVCTCTHVRMWVYVWACGGMTTASPVILSSTITFLWVGVGFSLAWDLLLMLGWLLSKPWAFSLLCFPALGCQTIRWGNSLHSFWGWNSGPHMCKSSFLPIESRSQISHICLLSLWLLLLWAFILLRSCDTLYILFDNILKTFILNLALQ